MPPGRAALAERISSLRDLVFAVCGTLSSHLQTVTGELKRELRALVVELRLLGGVIHGLTTLISDLEDKEPPEKVLNHGSDWPVVDGCKSLIAAIRSSLHELSVEALREAKAATLGYQAKISFVLGSSDSLNDIAAHFTVLATEPLHHLALKPVQVKNVLPPGAATPVDAHAPDATVVSSWLTLLNSQNDNGEPSRYKRLKGLKQMRQLTAPDYQKAASQWPLHAERYWNTLRPQICSLFRDPRSENFIQWVLEYARDKWPRIFGVSALSPVALVELTDALWGGSLSPLHVAAALGLPSLCQDLLLMGADVNQETTFGTPLLCSLLGPKVLTMRAKQDYWSFVQQEESESPDSRADTVLALLDAKADCSYKFRWMGTEPVVSLAGLTCQLALQCENARVFSRLNEAGFLLDDYFLQLLQEPFVKESGRYSKETIGLVLTSAYDATFHKDIPRAPTESETDDDQSDVDQEELDTLKVKIRQAIREIMWELHLDFRFSGESQRLEQVADDDFERFTRESVLLEEVGLLWRLAKDPRFNPNTPYDSTGDGGTILHMAAENNRTDMIDFLIQAGADITARDANGRSPIMVTNNREVLDNLVLKHGAPTTDVNEAGFSIWHLAASTNDDDLIRWLLENDPQKTFNINRESDSGLTPFLCGLVSSLGTLKEDEKANGDPRPIAAKRILLEIGDIPATWDSTPILHFAAEWGDLELLDFLLARRLDPRALDPRGCTILHRLNRRATTDFIYRLQSLCAGLPVLYEGRTPAETIISNIELRRNPYENLIQNTAHPSCFPRLCEPAYIQLLTDQVLRSHDEHGKGLWERYCSDILMARDSDANGELHDPYLIEAATWMVHRGAHIIFEQEHGISALCCFAKRLGPSPFAATFEWSPKTLPLVEAILSRASADVQAPFLISLHSTDLWRLAGEAATPRAFGLIKLILDEYFVKNPAVNTVLELSLIHDLPMSALNYIFDHAKMEYVRNRQGIIWKGIAHTRPSSVKAKLKLLIEKGLDLNAEVEKEYLLSNENYPKQTILASTVKYKDEEYMKLLIDLGADPTKGVHNYNAFMAVAELGYHHYLPKLMDGLPSPTSGLTSVYEEPNGCTFNILQIAAWNGHHQVLRYFLRHTYLIHHVDCVTEKNGWTPIQLAEQAGHPDCCAIISELRAHAARYNVVFHTSKTTGCEEFSAP